MPESTPILVTSGRFGTPLAIVLDAIGPSTAKTGRWQGETTILRTIPQRFVRIDNWRSLAGFGNALIDAKRQLFANSPPQYIVIQNEQYN